MREIEEGMPAAEFHEWLTYFDIEPPFNDWEAWAIACAGIYAPYSRRKVKAQDFLPRALRPQKAKQSPQHMLAIMSSLVTVQNNPK